MILYLNSIRFMLHYRNYVKNYLFYDIKQNYLCFLFQVRIYLILQLINDEIRRKENFFQVGE